MQVRKHVSKESTLALKPRADVTRNPKQGYQWPHKKDSCPPKNLIKKQQKLLRKCTSFLGVKPAIQWRAPQSTTGIHCFKKETFLL